MSLGICVKGPEGLVLAAESRVTLSASTQDSEIHVNFDNATKLLSFSDPNSAVGAVTYGQAIVGKTGRTAHSFLPEFEAKLAKLKKRLKVQEFANTLKDFFGEQWQENPIPDYPGPNMVFVVGGYNEDEHFGRVYVVELPINSSVTEKNPGAHQFGVTWGGQREIVDRILTGYDPRMLALAKEKFNLNDEQIRELEKDFRQFQMPIPLQILPLQDCVDLAIFFIRTTIDAQKLTIGIRGVGGPIEVATITRREGFKYVQRKKIVGEGGRNYGLADGK